MLRWFAAVLSLCMLAACDPPVDSADAKLKQALVGSWRFEYRTDFEQAVQGTVRLDENGKFFAMEMVKGGEGLSEARLSGPWYVTAGLFKMNTQEENGQKLAINQMSFFTCKLIEVSASGFTCRDDVRKMTYTYVRASAS